VEFRVVEADGSPVATQRCRVDRTNRPFRVGEETALKIGFRARLGGSNYQLSVRIFGPEDELLATSEGLIFFVTGRPGSVGVVDLRAAIEVDGVDRTDVREFA